MSNFTKQELNKIETVRSILERNKGNLASVTFTKKDGSERMMQINLISKKGVKGESASDSAKKAAETRAMNHPELINVLDMDLRRKGIDSNACRRSINALTVKRIACGGNVIKFD